MKLYSKDRKSLLNTVWIIAFSMLLMIARQFFPERSIYDSNLRSLFDAVFALGLLFIISLIAGGLGLKAIRRFEFYGLARLEQAVVGLAIGFGLLSYGVMLIGVAGFLNQWSILLWLIISAIFCWKESSEITSNATYWFQEALISWKKLSLWKKIISISIAIIFILYSLLALSPPIDPDGLIHHLQVSKKYLEAGRFYPIPELPLANYPLTIETIFMIGMSFGSDTFARLVHLTYGGLLLLATFTLGRRYLGSNGGWIAAAILIGMPIIPIWASLAYIDMGWALYEFLAVYFILLWAEKDQPHWLIMAGIMTGLSLGSKYLALAALFVNGLWVLWHHRSKSIKVLMSSGLLYGVTALLVASPWYLKNWLWLGNPVYPFLGPVVEKTLRTIDAFGFWDFVILPWHLYVNRDLFVGVYGSVEFLSPLFLLVLILPWTNKSKPIGWLAIITLLRYLTWALVSHVRMRYMLPIFPPLSVLSASVIIFLIQSPKNRKFFRVLIPGLIGGTIAISLLYSILFFSKTHPTGVILGNESKDSFLLRNLGDYGAIKYAKTNLPSDSRVYMMWDPRGYYCDERFLPDIYLNQWVHLFLNSENVSLVASSLRSQGVTHLLYDIESMDYKLQLSSDKAQRDALEFFYNEFRPLCTEEIYQSESAILYEFTCR